MVPLTNTQVRNLKAQAQKLEATLKVGKEGLSPQFPAALDEVLKHHELVKVKFDEFKEQKRELAPQLAEKSSSLLHPATGTERHVGFSNEPGGFQVGVECGWGGWIEA
jgi:RNA-binding protein